jgi:hypothetical protein
MVTEPRAPAGSVADSQLSYVFDKPLNFSGQHNFTDENKSFDNFADRLVRGVEDDAEMACAATGKAKKILISRDDNSALGSSKIEVGSIILRPQASFDCSCYIDASAP